MRPNNPSDLWKKVEKGTHPKGCWLWVGAKDNWGYGNFRLKNKVVKAHRVAWENCNGSIPNGMKVLHHCDNPTCVNPEHLFLGTDADNSRDAAIKNRMSQKLSIPEVLLIRSLSKIGEYQKTIALRFGINRSIVSRIVNGQRRPHV